MAEPIATLAYAHDAPDAPADRLLRRTVAWFAIVQGSAAVAGTALHFALAAGWATTPMAWRYGVALQIAPMVAWPLVMSALLVGGLLLLRRSPTSLVVLRAASVGWFGVLLAGHVIGLWLTPSMTGSTPATVTVYALRAVSSLLPAVLLGLLTLQPLGERMVPRA